MVEGSVTRKTTPTADANRRDEPVALAQYLRQIARVSSDSQLVQRLMALALHFDASPEAVRPAQWAPVEAKTAAGA